MKDPSESKDKKVEGIYFKIFGGGTPTSLT
jgi:hypothetical protein